MEKDYSEFVVELKSTGDLHKPKQS